jgi:hypothetical protein
VHLSSAVMLRHVCGGVMNKARAVALSKIQVKVSKTSLSHKGDLRGVRIQETVQRPLQNRGASYWLLPPHFSDIHMEDGHLTSIGAVETEIYQHRSSNTDFRLREFRRRGLLQLISYGWCSLEEAYVISQKPVDAETIQEVLAPGRHKSCTKSCSSWGSSRSTLPGPSCQGSLPPRLPHTLGPLQSMWTATTR